MSYEKYYPGGWQSGETGGTPITPEALNHIEDGIQTLDAAKAPVGFGLGLQTGLSEVTTPAQLDWLANNGWYSLALDSPVCGIGHGSVHVDASPHFVSQTVEGYNGAHEVKVRRFWNSGTSAWGEWEWENPPMVPGVEYRTTQRLNGAAVYTKYIHHGKGSSDGVVNINPGIDGSYYYVSTNIKAIGDNGWGGYINDSRVSINDGGLIYITMGADASGLDFYATIKYQK